MFYCLNIKELYYINIVFGVFVNDDVDEILF